MTTGDSESMVDDQGGQRIKILQRLLNAIASVYNLARERGISTVRFFNALQGKKNITAQTVKTVIKGHQYGGDTRVGTELERKIIDKFVIGIEMKKPLLVIVITDQAVGSLNDSRSLRKTEPEPSLGRGRIYQSLRRCARELPTGDEYGQWRKRTALLVPGYFFLSFQANLGTNMNFESDRIPVSPYWQ